MDESILVMAEALARSEVEAGIRKAQANLPRQPEDFDGCCVDCGDAIPAPRLKFGAITCLHCQTIRERVASLSKT